LTANKDESIDQAVCTAVPPTKSNTAPLLLLPLLLLPLLLLPLLLLPLLLLPLLLLLLLGLTLSLGTAAVPSLGRTMRRALRQSLGP
jgi:hypothetical protein